MKTFTPQYPIKYHASGTKDIASCAREISTAEWEFVKVFPFGGKFVVAAGKINLADYYHNYVWYIICEKFGFKSPKEFISKMAEESDTARYRDSCEMLFCEEVWGYIDSQHATEELALARLAEITAAGNAAQTA